MKKFVPVLRFFAMSDMHIKDVYTKERFYTQLAVQMMYEYAQSCTEYQGVDALCIVGDFANTGTEIQNQVFKDILDKNIKPETQVFIALGNHEFRPEGGGNDATMEKLKRIFRLY